METSTFKNGGQLEGLAQTARYNVEKLAVLSRLSSRQFRRIFHERFGCSPREWLKDLKLQKAESRLLAGEPVKEVAFELGYRHREAFCHWFRSVTGLWPTEYPRSKMPGPTRAAKMSDFRTR